MSSSESDSNEENSSHSSEEDDSEKSNSESDSSNEDESGSGSGSDNDGSDEGSSDKDSEDDDSENNSDESSSEEKLTGEQAKEELNKILSEVGTLQNDIDGFLSSFSFAAQRRKGFNPTLIEKPILSGIGGVPMISDLRAEGINAVSPIFGGTPAQRRSIAGVEQTFAGMQQQRQEPLYYRDTINESQHRTVNALQGNVVGFQQQPQSKVSDYNSYGKYRFQQDTIAPSMINLIPTAQNNNPQQQQPYQQTQYNNYQSGRQQQVAQHQQLQPQSQQQQYQERAQHVQQQANVSDAVVGDDSREQSSDEFQPANQRFKLNAESQKIIDSYYRRQHRDLRQGSNHNKPFVRIDDLYKSNIRLKNTNATTSSTKQQYHKRFDEDVKESVSKNRINEAVKILLGQK